MELSNRDSNFNRVFSTQQPLTVDPRAGKIGMSSQQVIASHKSNEPLLSKEKSFSYAFVQSIDEVGIIFNSSILSTVISAR
jgi:hypothetical protein